MQTLSLPNDNKMQLESQQTSMNGGWESQNHINIADYPNTRAVNRKWRSFQIGIKDL